MTKNLRRGLALLVICAVVFSVIAFAVPFKRGGVFWLSYVCGMFAIGIQLYVTRVAFRGAESVKSRYYGLPVARVGVLYAMIQLILSILFMALAAFIPGWIAAVIYMLLLVVAAVGFIGADAVRDEVERQEIQLHTDTTCMTELYAAVSSLVGKCDDDVIKKQLTDLTEAFRFSDPVSGEGTKTIEAELSDAVTKLKETVATKDAEEMKRECDAVSGLLADRNRLCKLGKRR